MRERVFTAMLLSAGAGADLAGAGPARDAAPADPVPRVDCDARATDLDGDRDTDVDDVVTLILNWS